MTCMSRVALVLRELVRRDFEVRYAGSFLGFLWSFAVPLWQLGLYYFVFSLILKVQAGGKAGFAGYLFAGLLPWLAVQEGILRGTTAITENAGLVKKLSFPSETLVVAVVAGALLQELIALVMFSGVLAAQGALHWQGLPLLLVALPLQLSLTTGLGLLFAGFQVFFRDLAQILAMVLSAWFYLTPIVYPMAYVPERFRALVSFNPLATIASLFRQALLGESAVSASGLGVTTVVAALSLVLGLASFRALRSGFVDEI